MNKEEGEGDGTQKMEERAAFQNAKEGQKNCGILAHVLINLHSHLKACQGGRGGFILVNLIALGGLRQEPRQTERGHR